MIAEQIWQGKSAKDLNISEGSYASRLELVARFTEEVQITDFGPQYLAWVATQPEGDVGRVEPNVMPSLKTRAVNLAVATAQHIAAGRPKSRPEEAARRWGICQGCTKLLDGKWCSMCGCGMEYKSTWQEQRCPLGKW